MIRSYSIDLLFLSNSENDFKVPSFAIIAFLHERVFIESFISRFIVIFLLFGALFLDDGSFAHSLYSFLAVH